MNAGSGFVPEVADHRTKLDSNGITLQLRDPIPAFRIPNGDILVATDREIWHWRSSGQLRRILKVVAPDKISNFYWGGSFYWVFIPEPENLHSLVYDNEGVLLGKHASYFSHFSYIDYSANRVLAMDTSAYLKEPYEDPVLRELKLSLDPGKRGLKVESLKPAFFGIPPAQRRLKFNFKSLYAQPSGDRWLIIDELESKIVTIQPDPKKPVPQFDSLEHLDLQLKKYIEPPPRLGWSDQVDTDIRSWSRINFFKRLTEGFLIGYLVPNDEDPMRMLTAIEVVDARGRSTGSPRIIAGKPLDFDDGVIYSFFAKETDSGGTYFLEKHRLKP